MNLDTKNIIKSAKFSPKGTHLISGEEKCVKIWDINKQKEINKYSEHIKSINSVKWSPDGVYCASSAKDHNIKLYDIRAKSAVQNIEAHSNSVTSIDFHPSKKYLVSCSLDSTIKIWDLFQNALLYTLYGHEGPIYSVNFNKNGEFICSGGIDGDVYLWRNNLEGNLIEKNEKINGGIAFNELKRVKSNKKNKINLRSKSSNKVRINKKCMNNEDYPINLNDKIKKQSLNKNINSDIQNETIIPIASTNIDSRELYNMKKQNNELYLSPEISKNFAEMMNKLDMADKVIKNINKRMINIENQLNEVNDKKNENNKENDINNANYENIKVANNYYNNNVIQKNENENPVEIFEDVNNHVEDIRQEVLKNNDYNQK